MCANTNTRGGGGRNLKPKPKPNPYGSRCKFFEIQEKTLRKRGTPSWVSLMEKIGPIGVLLKHVKIPGLFNGEEGTGAEN